MGKSRRPAPRSAARQEEAQGRGRDPEGRSNAAVAAERLVSVDLEVLRDLAAHAVERALLALVLPTRPTAQVDRFVEIVERSALPADRQSTLIGKLRADQAADRAVRRALERWLGSVDAREPAERLLAEVHQLLVQGGPTEGGWQVGERRIPLPEGVGEGGLRQRSNRLVAGLAEHSGSGVESAGSAAVGLVAALHHLVWDEEEEEEVSWPEAGLVED